MGETNQETLEELLDSINQNEPETIVRDTGYLGEIEYGIRNDANDLAQVLEKEAVSSQERKNSYISGNTTEAGLYRICHRIHLLNGLLRGYKLDSEELGEASTYIKWNFKKSPVGEPNLKIGASILLTYDLPFVLAQATDRYGDSMDILLLGVHERDFDLNKFESVYNNMVSDSWRFEEVPEVKYFVVEGHGIEPGTSVNLRTNSSILYDGDSLLQADLETKRDHDLSGDSGINWEANLP